MGCQSQVILGANLTFTITTHDPDTGELTDADAAPSYRVYEDETAVPILTGTMALLDAALWVLLIVMLLPLRSRRAAPRGR